MQIMLKKDGVETGPFTREDVVAMLADGRINRTDLAFQEGLSNWLPVQAVIAPRATPPPFKEKSEAFETSRVKPNETIAQIVKQTQSLDWAEVIPLQVGFSRSAVESSLGQVDDLVHWHILAHQLFIITQQFVRRSGHTLPCLKLGVDAGVRCFVYYQARPRSNQKGAGFDFSFTAHHCGSARNRQKSISHQHVLPSHHHRKCG